MSRQQVWKVIALTLLVCGSVYGQHNITSFDAPMPGPSPVAPPVNTVPTAINPAGDIVGYVFDANNVYHGFVRSRNGSFTNIDATALGAGNTPNAYPAQGTQVISINSTGVIVGYYIKSDGTTHCFLRTPDGTITNIDPPGSLGAASPPPEVGGGPIVINDLGAVAGNCKFANDYFPHGFLRTPIGNFTTFGGPAGYNYYTIPTAINSAGAITGYSAYNAQGFLRNPDGTIVGFNPFGPGNYFASGGNIYTYGINDRGEIIGSYQVYSFGYPSGPPIGFLRTANGVIITIAFPGAYVYQTVPSAINAAGTITGSYTISQYSGFVRTADGHFTSFDPPGSIATSPAAINPSGEITGNYGTVQQINGLFVFITHGFLRLP